MAATSTPRGARLARSPSPLRGPLHAKIGLRLNAVEGFFAKLSKRRLKRGVLRSLVDLQAAINRFLAQTNDRAQALVWTADPDQIIAAIRRRYQGLDSIQ